MTDLTKLAQSDTAFMALKNPRTGEPILCDDKQPMGITLWSMDAREFKDRQRARQNKILEETENARRVFQTVEDVDRNAIGVFVDATHSWNIIIDGKTPDVGDPAAVAAVYSDPRFGWLREDVDRWLARKANFIKGSSQS